MSSSSTEDDKSSNGNHQTNILALGRAGRSAFTPYKSSTVLTNLQRGNVRTQTIRESQDRTIFELAAQGELQTHHIDKSNINETDENNYTLLLWASAYGQLNTVKTLIEHGADVNHRGIRGETAISFASMNGHVHVLRYLLTCNIDVNHCDEEGNTPLMFAAYNNHALCAHELIKANADVTCQNSNLDTAYSIAISRKSKQVQLILERHILNQFAETS
ncbi:uncharacterized protein LOC141853121 [Brevipalpus obovatus]|uniref:uncharacterized protein LOC141853121 n=1 Tax=Brevipalpus obovatus TaxID=246614 RepID=UPI003D9E8D99